MRFRYLAELSGDPIISLGGRMDRPRPIIPIGIMGPLKAVGEDAAIDTMSDDTIFPVDVAQAVGIDLSTATVKFLGGIGGPVHPVAYAHCSLRMTDGIEFREWPAWVGFTSAPLRFPLLGFAGFLQFFTATFQGDREEVELAVNSLYPGT